MANGDRLWYVSHDFNNRRLKEVGDAVQPGDAVPLRQVQAIASGATADLAVDWTQAGPVVAVRGDVEGAGTRSTRSRLVIMPDQMEQPAVHLYATAESGALALGDGTTLPDTVLTRAEKGALAVDGARVATVVVAAEAPANPVVGQIWIQEG